MEQKFQLILFKMIFLKLVLKILLNLKQAMILLKKLWIILDIFTTHLIKPQFLQDNARSRDDLDMERALRKEDHDNNDDDDGLPSPDVVKSALDKRDKRINHATIEHVFLAPDKIKIPERYVAEAVSSVHTLIMVYNGHLKFKTRVSLRIPLYGSRNLTYIACKMDYMCPL